MLMVYRPLLVMLLLTWVSQYSLLILVRGQALQGPAQNGAQITAESAFKQGQALRAQGSPESLKKAIEKYEEALLIFRSINDRQSEGRVLFVLGATYAGMKEQQKAIESYNQALTIVRAIGNKKNEATTLGSLGLLYDSTDDRRQALEHYSQALLLQRVVVDRRGEMLTLIRMGDDYNNLKEQQKALGVYIQALPITRELGDRRAEATTLQDIGAVYDVLGEKQKAIDNYNLALLGWRAVNDRSGETLTLFLIGQVYDFLSDRRQALEFYSQALSSARATGERSIEVKTLLAMGVAFNYLGEKQKALKLYQQALTITKTLGDRHGEAQALLRIGNIYNSLGETQKGLDYYNEVLPIQRALGDRSGEAATLNNIGTVYIILDKQKALDYFNQALPNLTGANDQRDRATTINNIGSVYDLLGDKQKALGYYKQALPIAQKVNDHLHEARTFDKIGAIYADSNDIQKALEFYSKALALEGAIGDDRGEASTLAGLMLLWKERNLAYGVFYGKQAVNIFERLRANITGLDKELQRTFLRRNEGTYRILADLLMKSGRLPEAQEILNLFKDQQFYDFNSGTQKQLPLATLTTGEATAAQRYELATKRVEAIVRSLDELKLKIGEGRPSAEDAASLQQLQLQLNTALDDFLKLLKQSEVEFAGRDADKDKVKEIADTRELQSTLSELNRKKGEKAVAVYTLVGTDTFRTLLITAEKITAASQPTKGEALNQKALQLWGLLQSDKYDPTPLATELYSVIFKPLEALLPADTTTILWSLDGNLRYLPMAALYDGKQYLVERYDHVVFTRADRERLLRAVSPRWTGLGLASSKAHKVELLGDEISFNALPGVNEELRVIFRQNGLSEGIIEGTVLPDAEFTKTAMLSALEKKRPLVHISSHFSFRPGDEARSFLLLGDGSAMTLEEMKQHPGLFGGVELLTLSACNTAAQQADANGREIDGFAELAQRLGAGSVMATLWPVADNSTPWLMREFYQTRQSGSGMTKADAIRRAQLALLNGTAKTQPLPEAQKGSFSPVKIVITPNESKRDGGVRSAEIVYVSEKDGQAFKRDDKKPFAHPYYWAPFILIGNWR